MAFAAGTCEMFVSCEPSTAGSLALPSNCTILLAAVPTSTAMVPDAVIVPPVKPVPAIILVTVPTPPALVQPSWPEPSVFNTWLAVPSVAG